MIHFIIVNYLSDKVALRHLEAGVFPSGSFIHLVDNSPSGTGRSHFRKLYGSICEAKGCKLNWYRCENKGFAHANNTALRKIFEAAVESDVIVLLNSDASIIPAGDVEAQLGNAEPKNIYGGVLYYSNKDIAQLSIQAVGGSNELAPGVYRELKKTNTSAFVQLDGYINGAFLYCTVATFKKVGLLPEEYFLYYEETEWCRRAIDLGCALWCNQNISIAHEHGVTTKTDDSKRKSVSQFRNKNYYYIRNMIHHFKTRGELRFFFMYMWILLRVVSQKSLGVLMYDQNKIKRFKILLTACVDGCRGRMS